MRTDGFAICENVVPNSTLPSPPPGPVSQFPWKNFPTVSAEEFYYSFYYNEGLENKLTRAPLLGLAKSIYYDSQISVPAAFPSSTIVQFVYPWPVIDTLRLTNISQFFSTPTIDKFKIWRRKILSRFLMDINRI